MRAKKAKTPCKHDWKCGSYMFDAAFKESMRCQKCGLYRDFTAEERDIYKTGHHFGRISAFNKIQSLFSVSLRQASEER